MVQDSARAISLRSGGIEKRGESGTPTTAGGKDKNRIGKSGTGYRLKKDKKDGTNGQLSVPGGQ